MRYLFSIFPVFDFSYSLIGLAQTQAENNVCVNYIDKDTLTLVCTQIIDATSSGQVCGKLFSPKMRFDLVYDRNHYFGLGPKPKLADTFGRLRNRYRNHILKGESSYQ